MELSVASRQIQMTSQRSQADLNAYFRELRPWLFRLALAIVAEPNLAEDVVQETMIRAARARKNLTSIDEPKAWLRIILVRRAMTALKRPLVLAYGEVPADVDAELTMSVRHTLDRLSAADRTLLALVHFEQLSYVEIAETLGIPEGTVASRLHSARQAFKKEWQR
jgi:RNA polymerase sigma-70 factor (ECF subfamily)